MNDNIYLVYFDEDSGDLIEKVSLVDCPAIERNFVAFSKEKQKTLYSITDDEKRVVTGALLLADTPIYRNDPVRGEYYMLWKPDVVEKYAQSYLKNKNTSSVNLMHAPDTDVDGVYMYESYITSKNKGIYPSFLSDIPDGSWIGSFKIDNDKVWSSIKSGEYKGFSIEAWTSMATNVDIDNYTTNDDILFEYLENGN